MCPEQVEKRAAQGDILLVTVSCPVISKGVWVEGRMLMYKNLPAEEIVQIFKRQLYVAHEQKRGSWFSCGVHLAGLLSHLPAF